MMRNFFGRKLNHFGSSVSSFFMTLEHKSNAYFFKKFDKFVEVWRFLLTWAVLAAVLLVGVFVQFRMLNNYYKTPQPVSGGTYREAVIGTFTNANPIYASGSVDNTVSSLVFSSLLRYDEENRLVGDLARQWSVDDSGLEYTVLLRDDVFWHDGFPFTAEDVEFTYNVIKSADSRSFLNSNWLNIDVEKIDDYSVRFVLPNVFSPFPHSLTNGIIPKHILGDVEVSQLRSSSFNNIEPIGTGPFRWSAVEARAGALDERSEIIALSAYEDYHLGQPLLNGYRVYTYTDELRALDAMDNKVVNAISGLGTLPSDYLGKSWINEVNIPLTAQVNLFFNNSAEVFESAALRRALVQMIDQRQVVEVLDYPVLTSSSPLLPVNLGYSDDIKQLKHDEESAKKKLEDADWALNDEGYWQKGDDLIEFTLTAQATPDFIDVATNISDQLSRQGVVVSLDLRDESQMQEVLSGHSYDALLHGIAVGVDPDVFAYWHSSQGSAGSMNRLNFSQYNSAIADEALEAARTRQDGDIRAVKYEQFLSAWQDDAPAVSLYQPRYYYIYRGKLHNFEPKSINSASGRLANVHNWAVRDELQPVVLEQQE
jgi:peptide/nickel transport system substrate-binding protein